MPIFDAVSLTEALNYLKCPEDDSDFVQSLITNVSSQAEKYTGRFFVQRAVTEYKDADGDDELFLKKYPIIGVPVVTDTANNAAVTDFITYNEEGYLYREIMWDDGRRRWKVEYASGYAEDTASVPSDIKQAVLEWIASRYNRTDPSVRSEGIGDLSTSYESNDQSAMPATTKAFLDKYKVVEF